MATLATAPSMRRVFFSIASLDAFDSQGLDLQGRMTRDRLGKRIAALKVAEETKRMKHNGKKVTLYRIDPQVIIKKLENHLRG